MNFDVFTFVWVALAFVTQQCVGWVLKSWLDDHKAQVKKALNFQLLMVLFDVLVMIYIVWFAFKLFDNVKPAVRQDLLVALGLQTFLCIVFANFIDDLSRWVKATRAPSFPAINK